MILRLRVPLLSSRISRNCEFRIPVGDFLLHGRVFRVILIERECFQCLTLISRVSTHPCLHICCSGLNFILHCRQCRVFFAEEVKNSVGFHLDDTF